MPQAALANQHLGRSLRGLPYAACENVRTLVRDDGKSALVATSGVELFTQVGSDLGFIQGLFQMDGVLGGDLIIIAAGKVYRVSKLGVVTSLGNVSNGVGLARIATSLTETIAIQDNKAYQILSSGVNQLIDPDLGEVVDVIYAAGLFVYVVKDSDRIKWSEVLNAAVIGAASFATAESKPDRLRGIATLGDDIVLFGYETIEVWGKTGDITLPFSPRAGAMFNTGCAARDSIVSFGDGTIGNKIAWLGSDRIVRITDGSGAQQISHNALNEEIEKLSEDELSGVSSFAWCEEGSWFLCFQLPNSSWVYDVKLGLWHLRTALSGKWPISCTCEAWGRIVCGSNIETKIGFIEPQERYTFGERIRRLFTAYLPTNSGFNPVTSITLRIALGLDDNVAEERFVWLDWSDDRGNLWKTKRRKSLGVQGKYKSSVTWSPCGSTKNAGRVMRFEITDPYQLTVVGVVVNEVQA